MSPLVCALLASVGLLLIAPACIWWMATTRRAAVRGVREYAAVIAFTVGPVLIGVAFVAIWSRVA